MKLSVIIPSYKDPYLKNTIEDILKKSELGDQLEVIAILDGYWTADIVDDPRVKYLHLGGNRGMREAINAGIDIAQGEFLMRTDEHCLFDQGFDKKMTDVCQGNWIMTAKRYFLDPVKWEVMKDKGHVEYEKLVIQGKEGGVQKFAGKPWKERDIKRKDYLIDETMAMQGSCWVMPRKLWKEVIVKLDNEGYGPLYQDSHEMVFKIWQAGGKFMLNKNTWFAHKHRSFSRTHNNGTKENPSNNEQCWAYALEVWRDYYENEVKKQWKI